MRLCLRDRGKCGIYVPIKEESDISDIIEKLSHRPVNRFPMKLHVYTSCTRFLKEKPISAIDYSGFIKIVRADYNFYWFYGGTWEVNGEGLYLLATIPSWEPKIIDDMPKIQGIDKKRWGKTIITIQPYIEEPLS